MLLLSEGHTWESTILNLLIPVLNPLNWADGSVHSQFLFACIIAIPVLADEELVEAGPVGIQKQQVRYKVTAKS